MPAAVRATGKLRVHIQANVHAGEIEGKESAQVLLRGFAMGQHQDWLQSMVFLITPIFNADGNERFSLTSRLPQNGPARRRTCWPQCTPSWVARMKPLPCCRNASPPTTIAWCR